MQPFTIERQDTGASLATFDDSGNLTIAGNLYAGGAAAAPGAPVTGAAGGLARVAATSMAGFALQAATPDIISWTAPDDGQLHRALAVAVIHVTSAETGGQVNLTWYAPFSGAAVHTSTMLAPGLGTDTGGQVNTVPFVLVQPGTTVTIAQGSALTLGAATVWAEIWAS